MGVVYIEEFGELPKEIEEEMLQDLWRYDSSRGINMNYNKYSFILKNDVGQAIGVLSHYTIFAEVFIDMLWIDARYRGRGLGKTLVQKLEDKYKNQGFNNINLCTYAFQAPEFYEKCGFTLEFIRENKLNPSFTKYFFVKFFEESVQKQGLV